MSRLMTFSGALVAFVLAATVLAFDPVSAIPSDPQAANEVAEKASEPTHNSADERIAVYTAWLTAFTGVLAVATGGLIWATHRLGERADAGMRTLERPSVHFTIHSHDGTQGAIPRTINFEVRNYGKTPAFIVAAQKWLQIDEQGNAGDNLVGRDLLLNGRVFGERDFHASSVASTSAARIELERSEKNLLLFARVTYRDLWDNEYVEDFKAEYLRPEIQFKAERSEKFTPAKKAG